MGDPNQVNRELLIETVYSNRGYGVSSIDGVITDNSILYYSPLYLMSVNYFYMHN